MQINSNTIISITDANQNFSKVAKMVEKNGQAVIFKNNKPKFMMLDINNSQAILDVCKQLSEMEKEKRAAGR